MANSDLGSLASRRNPADSLEYYFFFSSIDNKELVRTECPLIKGKQRLTMHFCMHKFEKVLRLKEGAKIFNVDGDLANNESMQIDDE